MHNIESLRFMQCAAILIVIELLRMTGLFKDVKDFNKLIELSQILIFLYLQNSAE